MKKKDILTLMIFIIITIIMVYVFIPKSEKDTNIYACIQMEDNVTIG